MLIKWFLVQRRIFAAVIDTAINVSVNLRRMEKIPYGFHWTVYKILMGICICAFKSYYDFNNENFHLTINYNLSNLYKLIMYKLYNHTLLTQY